MRGALAADAGRRIETPDAQRHKKSPLHGDIT